MRALRRAFSLGFPAGAIVVFIHWRGAAEVARANSVRAVAGAGAVIFCDWVGELGGQRRRDRLAAGW